jgi:hypothetical protein
MAWDRSAPSDPKYRSKAHREYRDGLVRQLERQGYLICTAPVCVLGDRTITNPNGRAPDGLTAGHEDDGVNYRGPEHLDCNRKDGARRGNRRSRQRLDSKRWAL